MKHRLFCLILLMSSLSLLTLSCSSDDNNSSPNDNSIVIADVTATVQTGTWKITSYVDSGEDETNHFTGYNFTFNPNGTLVAVKESTTVSGTWSVTDSSNSSDDSYDLEDVDFNIAFSSPADFNDLSEDWHIVTKSSTQISLIHVSGGNGGTDTLIFQKN